MGLYGYRGSKVTHVGSAEERQGAVPLLTLIGEQLEAALADTPSEYLVLQAVGIDIASACGITVPGEPVSSLQDALGEAQSILAKYGINRSLTDLVCKSARDVHAKVTGALQRQEVTSRSFVGSLDSLLDFLEAQHLPGFRRS
jgi:hypothetical protein